MPGCIHNIRLEFDSLKVIQISTEFNACCICEFDKILFGCGVEHYVEILLHVFRGIRREYYMIRMKISFNMQIDRHILNCDRLIYGTDNVQHIVRPILRRFQRVQCVSVDRMLYIRQLCSMGTH